MQKEYIEIAEYLKEKSKTENEAVRAGDLGALFNLTKRGIRAIVTVLRQEGYPICSSNCGYWYGTDPADIEKTGNRLMAQAESMRKAAEGLYRGMNGK